MWLSSELENPKLQRGQWDLLHISPNSVLDAQNTLCQAA